MFHVKHIEKKFNKVLKKVKNVKELYRHDYYSKEDEQAFKKLNYWYLI